MIMRNRTFSHIINIPWTRSKASHTSFQRQLKFNTKYCVIMRHKYNQMLSQIFVFLLSHETVRDIDPDSPVGTTRENKNSPAPPMMCNRSTYVASPRLPDNTLAPLSLRQQGTHFEIFKQSIHPHVNHSTTTVTFHIHVQTPRNMQPLFYLFYFSL